MARWTRANRASSYRCDADVPSYALRLLPRRRKLTPTPQTIWAIPPCTWRRAPDKRTCVRRRARLRGRGSCLRHSDTCQQNVPDYDVPALSFFVACVTGAVALRVFDAVGPAATATDAAAAAAAAAPVLAAVIAAAGAAAHWPCFARSCFSDNNPAQHCQLLLEFRAMPDRPDGVDRNTALHWVRRRALTPAERS
jgi:hypothetical protein